MLSVIACFRSLLLPLVCLSALWLAGCASPPQRAAVAPPTQSTTRPDPATWIGRWHGAGAARVDVLPTAGERQYQLIFRNENGVSVAHTATAANGRLYYQRGDRNLALRPGLGAETGQPDQRLLAHCLIAVPGNAGYCRHADSADAMPLQTGAYVAIRTPCGEAAPSDALFFDGRRLLRPTSPAACRTRLVSQQGVVFSLADSCAPGASAQTGFNETVTTPGEIHLAVTPTGAATADTTRLYRYCATGLLPPGLRAQAPH